MKVIFLMKLVSITKRASYIAKIERGEQESVTYLSYNVPRGRGEKNPIAPRR